MAGSDVQITYNEDFEELVEAVSGARRPGDYYSAGILETPMPTLKVAGAGVVAFPVPHAQVRELVAAAERAPYGKGDKTLVDESVRKVWQISPEKIQISGNGWLAQFGGLVNKIAVDLGCEGQVIEAEFYKLLVYEKGGFFVSHRDTEKSGGMFGTLVVVLPCSHKGGDLQIRHAGREATLRLAGEEPGEVHYAAFYADCEHEVKPVTSGHRVCLIYNLVQKEKRGVLLPPDHRPAVAVAARSLRGWAEGVGQPDKLVYLLDHHYTQESISFAALKGSDAAFAKVLLEAATEAGCAAHLGIVHIEESGWAEYTGRSYGWRDRYADRGDDDDSEDYDIGDVCDGRYYISNWRDAEDSPAEFGEIPLLDGEVLPPGALDGEEPDESHFSEATGNEGASFERTYLRAAVVLWPEARYDRVCASAGPDASLARLEILVSAALDASPSDREVASEAAVRFARILPEVWRAERGEGLRLGRLIACLNRFGNAELFTEILGPILPCEYDGSQNMALAGSVKVLGPERAAQIIASAILERGAIFPAAGIELWTLIACDREREASSETLLRSVLEALLKALPCFKARKTILKRQYELQYFGREPDGKSRLDQRTKPSAQGLGEFFAALHASSVAGMIPKAVSLVVGLPALFSPEKSVLPCLELPLMPPGDGADALWAHCAVHYLGRSEVAPQKPADWAQDVRLAGKSDLIRELEAFARDPVEQVHRFRVRKDLRQEIHAAIEAHGLDMTHVTERKGNPQTLVCTKTRTTYERALRQYASDLDDMRRLLALPCATASSHKSLVDRLKAAVGG